PPEFVTGETIFYLGKSHRLRVTEGILECLAFDGTEFLLEKENKDPFQVFRAWFIRQAEPFFNARVEWFQRRTTSVPRGIKVCDLGFRWGSCGPTGHLNFNWQLIQLPVRMIDYVVAHELTHLAVPNHSKHFWRSLGAMLPDYMERRDELAADAHRFLRFRAPPPRIRTSHPLGGHNRGEVSFSPAPSLHNHTHQP
ncbi:MAG: M48 family metallopeptidase, partial [Akkermansiaceae bacterium]|nr:M48 family metallopeptidase [Akkermansiaceae bacterium]